MTDGWEFGKEKQRGCVNKSLANPEAAKLKQTGKAVFVLVTPVIIYQNQTQCLAYLCRFMNQTENRRRISETQLSIGV
jgi:mannitol/fructose-specific phosphotransferase system IIA component (Ntr-type)